MSQHSEDSLPFESKAASARIIPFERPLTDAPQSDLQRAVQLRAQEEMDLRRSRETRKPQFARWLIGTVVAMVPVFVMVSGVDGFLRIFHSINAMYAAMPAPEADASSSEPIQTEPGVVMLRPMETYDQAVKRARAAPAAEPAK